MMNIIDMHARLIYDRKTNSYDISDCITDMNNNKIEYRVISALEGESIQKQNDSILEITKANPRLIACAILNPKEADVVEETKRIVNNVDFKLVEFHSLYHGYYPEKMENVLLEVFKILSSREILIKVFTGHGFYTVPDQWAYYAKKFPQLEFIIEHMGGTDFSYGTIDLAKEVDNLRLELSYETELPVLKRAFRELPIEKLMYGSNYPSNFTDLSILKYNAIEMEENDKIAFFRKNAEELLKLNR